MFEPRKRAYIVMKILTVYTLNSLLLTIKAHITEKSYAFVVCWNIWSLFEKNVRLRFIWVYTVCLNNYVNQ